MQVMHNILLARIQTSLVERAEKIGCRSAILVGFPGNQVTCQDFQELICDNGSTWCTAIADIQLFYDTICPAALARSLIGHGIPIAEATFAAGLHAALVIVLCHAQMVAAIFLRTRGLLTGSRSASLLAMFPLMDVFSQCPDLITQESKPLEPRA
jgi:hypothetical protein